MNEKVEFQKGFSQKAAPKQFNSEKFTFEQAMN